MKLKQSELLTNVLDAHGGLDNWRRVKKLTARISLGGPFWAGRGWPESFDLDATVDARRQRIELRDDHRVSVFDVAPERLTLWTVDGEVLEKRHEPRASFPPFDQQTTRWDAVQIAYFQSTANWNYLTAPFVFTYHGVKTREIEPWQEDGETWRRLAVTFPAGNANHNAEPVAHYTYDPVSFDGFVFPTRRKVHLHDADGIADKTFAVITDDISDIKIGRG